MVFKISRLPFIFARERMRANEQPLFSHAIHFDATHPELLKPYVRAKRKQQQIHSCTWTNLFLLGIGLVIFIDSSCHFSDTFHFWISRESKSTARSSGKLKKLYIHMYIYVGLLRTVLIRFAIMFIRGTTASEWKN